MLSVLPAFLLSWKCLYIEMFRWDEDDNSEQSSVCPLEFIVTSSFFLVQWFCWTANQRDLSHWRVLLPYSKTDEKSQVEVQLVAIMWNTPQLHNTSYQLTTAFVLTKFSQTKKVYTLIKKFTNLKCTAIFKYAEICYIHLLFPRSYR